MYIYIVIYIRQIKTVLLVGPKWLMSIRKIRYTISKSKDKHQFLVFHKGLVSTGNIKDYPWLGKCVGILGLLGF